MDINILQDILKMAKEVKSPLVYIKDNYVYGVDESFVYIKSMEIQNIYNINIAFKVNDMASFIKGVDLNIIKQVNPTTLYSSFDNTVEINNPDLIMRIESMVSNIFYMCHTTRMGVVKESIRELEDFERILAFKSAQGSDTFVYNGYVMTIFNNLLPVKKADKVELTVYDIDSTKFLSNFSVVRKKSRIEVFVMYLHL